LLFLDSLLAFKENIDRFNALPAVVTTSFS
jgi:hypothetical protein